MRNFGASLLLLAAGLLFGQCSNEAVAPKPDYDQVRRELMTKLAPQLLGTWQLRQLRVQASSENRIFQVDAGIRRDTVLQNFAMLTIRPATVPSSNLPNPQYPDFEGDLLFRGRQFPVRFTALASPNRVVNGQGPQAYFSLQSNLPPGSYPPDADREYLQNIGLTSDSFTLEMLAGEQAMIWRGLNRGIVKIELQKQ